MRRHGQSPVHRVPSVERQWCSHAVLPIHRATICAPSSARPAIIPRALWCISEALANLWFHSFKEKYMLGFRLASPASIATKGDVHHRQRLDERARHRRAAMCDHVDLAVARRRTFPVVERPDRNLAPDRPVEACASPLATARRDLYIAEHAIDRCSTDRENKITVCLAKLQSAMFLEGWQQSRDHHL